MNEAAIKANYGGEFRRCLIDLDVKGIMRVWKHINPHLPQPSSESEALYSLHMARTGANSVPHKLRLYSQRWLSERGFGSLMSETRRERQH